MGLGHARSVMRVGIIVSIFRRSFYVFRAIKAKGVIPERSVVKVAVMWLIRFRIGMLAEMLARDAHARDRDFSLQLERANQLHERGQKSNLLLHR